MIFTLDVNAAALIGVEGEVRSCVRLCNFTHSSGVSVHLLSRAVGSTFVHIQRRENRSQAGAAGQLSDIRAAAISVGRRRAAASALDRRAGRDVPAHLHPPRDRRESAEACLPGWTRQNLLIYHLLLGRSVKLLCHLIIKFIRSLPPN